MPVVPARAAPAPAGLPLAPPLCVDLDGTLIATDLFAEAALSSAVRAPFSVFGLLAAFSGGRARARAYVAARADVDVASLPYRADVLDFLTAERAKGRTIVLATAADASLARRVADHLGLFDEVLASDGATNLKGEAKA